MVASAPSRVSPDSARDDEFLPTADDWREFFAYVDALGHYPDEAPELDDEFQPDPEDEAWWDALTAGGFNPQHGSPWDLELLTMSAFDFHYANEDEPTVDHPHGAFVGGLS